MYNNNYAANNRRPHFNFDDSIKAFFKNYLKFDGRASRSEFWWAMLFTFIVSSILSSFGPGNGVPHGFTQWIFSILGSIWDLIILIPTVTLTTRRLHDTDRSGWWQLLYFVPIIGWIPLIMFLVQDSKIEGAKHDGPVQPWAPNIIENNMYNQQNMNNSYNNMPYPTDNNSFNNANNDMPYRNIDDGGLNLNK